MLREVSMTFKQGSRTLIAGPNGSGKTTLLRLLSGLSYPSAGRVIFDGKPLRLGKNAGFAGGELFLYPQLTVLQNLSLVGVADPASALKRIELERQADLPARNLSAGQKQRLGFLRALSSSPQILSLDEPLSFLDERSREIFSELLESYRGTLICSGHERDYFLTKSFQLAEIKDGKLF